MAANNYFGFTHGGTQYGGNNPTYQTGQAGYPVTPSTPAPSYTPQRPQTGYDTTYQPPTTHTNPANYTVGTGTTAAPSTYDYGYGRPAQPNYDTTKTYYQQPTPAATPTYTTTETHYQASTKPTFNNTSTYTPPTRQTPTPKPNNYTSTYSTQASSYTTGYTPNVQTTNTTKAPQSNTNYSTYDASAYNTTPMYVTPQAQTVSAITGTGNKTSNTWKGYKNGSITTSNTGMKQLKQKPPSKSQQLHYCDVCKISCAGPQTYREHLDGQKHKKKESAQKAGSAPVSRGGNALRCELCDVTCTGTDAYAAHIRGAKHQKVLKLHTKLGKPIPSTDPVLLGNNKLNSNTSAGSTPIKTLVGSAIKTISLSPSSISGSAAKKAIPNVPKVNFVSAGSLGTVSLTGNGAPEVKQEFISVKEETNTLDNDSIIDKDIQPVGQDYIEEIKNEEGKVISFNCKLCECRFNDPNAKEMHMKGRRHRLQYKKKVNPDLVVDVKPSLRQRKLQEEKLRRQQLRDEYWRRRDEERMMEEEERMYWEERRRYEEEYEYEWYRRYGRDPRSMSHPPRPFGPPGVPPLMFFPQPMRRPDSSDDRHVIARHAEIYPKEEELQAVQKIVSHTEKALKFVSDHLTDTALSAIPKTNLSTNNSTSSDKPNFPKQTTIIPSSASSSLNTKQESKEEDNIKNQVKDENKKEDGRDGQLFSFQRDKDDQFPPILKGVMRVGMLAKGLLLHGDTNVNLVVLCGEKPTRTLLNRVADNLPKQLQVVTPDEQYKVNRNIEEACISVSGMSETNKITVTITLTSPIMREQILCSGNQTLSSATSDVLGDSVNVSQASLKEPVDVLDKQKCLDALAALRHAKWFQARATGLQSCVMVIRILRDLCQRVPTWSPLQSWAMELLVEKVISSAGQPLTPGDALRRVMESLASGILLDGGPGIYDPCEKDPSDPTSSLSPQKREDITASAQHALRLIVFRQIHKVLGMEPLPPLKFPRGRFNRKRRRDNSTGEGNDSEAVDGKKDKKGDDEFLKMETEK